MNETESSRGSGGSSNPALPGRGSDEQVTRDEVAQQVDVTRQQLLDLQQRKEELEREKNELEDLRRKQDEFELGRREMLEHLGRSLVLLEHDQMETDRRAENLRNALASFMTAKEQLESIREDQWSNANLKAELTKALAVVDTARNDFNHYRARLDCLDEKRNTEGTAPAGFGADLTPPQGLLDKVSISDLVKVGFWVSLPLIVLGVVLVLVLARR